MRPFGAALCAAMILAGTGCGRSPQEICEAEAALACERNHACQREETKAGETFQALYGASVEACRTLVAGRRGCAALEEADGLCTGDEAGLAYDEAQGEACELARTEQSCAAFVDPARVPEPCLKRCQAADE